MENQVKLEGALIIQLQFSTVYKKCKKQEITFISC